MIVVMDQMQPGYAKQFNMKNVLWLQNHGVTFPNAYVGDMASETVVSHNVMVSGLYPKHMGWSDEVLRDVDNVLGFEAGAIVTTGDLGTADYVKLIKNLGYPKMGDYLHAKFPGKKVVCVGEKSYQVESMAASSADLWVRMGSTKATTALPDPSVVPWTGSYRGPSGNVPGYIATNPRFLISSGNPGNPFDTYGTKLQWPSWLYPEDGRMTPGVPGHEGGDSWVADATTAIMEHEDWSGIFVNFGAIDKIGHMWGGGSVDTVGNYHWDPLSILDQVHMPFIAKHADEQLGKLIAKLKDLGEFDDTLIVVTADHGSTHAVHFNGVNALNGGTPSWYYDPNSLAANTTYGRPGANNESVLGPLNATGNVAYSYQSTAIETWLIDQSWDKKVACAAVMRTLPGVIATYARDGDKYVLISQSATMTDAERAWWEDHGQELVDSMAFSGAADVVGLLADYTSYGVFGDHGGAQMDVQRIPMAWYMPGLKRAVSNTPLRLVDIMPTMLTALGITPTDPMDGSAYPLNLPK
jgi:hypothetical protein